MSDIRESTLCPLCGADSRKHCDLEEENGGSCPWEDSGLGDEDAPTDGFSPFGRSLVEAWFGDEETPNADGEKPA